MFQARTKDLTSPQVPVLKTQRGLSEFQRKLEVGHALNPFRDHFLIGFTLVGDHARNSLQNTVTTWTCNGGLYNGPCGPYLPPIWLDK